MKRIAFTRLPLFAAGLLLCALAAAGAPAQAQGRSGYGFENQPCLQPDGSYAYMCRPSDYSIYRENCWCCFCHMDNPVAHGRARLTTADMDDARTFWSRHAVDAAAQKDRSKFKRVRPLGDVVPELADMLPKR
ncbi:MAG TPA: hypothetical protein PKO45_02615 [Rubrivivax sp.]|nr:hypothetical protein [Rubrivivax sp.]